MLLLLPLLLFMLLLLLLFLPYTGRSHILQLQWFMVSPVASLLILLLTGIDGSKETSIIKRSIET